MRAFKMGQHTHVFARCTRRSSHCLLLPAGAGGVPFLPRCLDEVPKHPEERRWRVERSLSHRWPGAFPPLGPGEPRPCRVTDHPRRPHTRPTRTMWVNAFIHRAKLCDEHQVLPKWNSPGRKLPSVTLFPAGERLSGWCNVSAGLCWGMRLCRSVHSFFWIWEIMLDSSWGVTKEFMLYT